MEQDEVLAYTVRELYEALGKILKQNDVGDRSIDVLMGGDYEGSYRGAGIKITVPLDPRFIEIEVW